MQGLDSIVRGWRGGVLVAMLACLVYVNTFPGHYFLDDYLIVQTNPLVSSPDLKTILLSDYWGPNINSGLYRPLVILSFAVKNQLFGPGPLVDHLVNVLLHMLVCFMLFLVLTRRGISRGIAWIAAALFAVHPIHTEVVNEAVGRSELLATLGVLLVIYTAGEISSWRRYPLIALGFLLGALSKENAVVVLALLPLFDGFRWAKGFREWWLSHWRNYACLLGTAGAWLAWRTWGVRRWVPADAADSVFTPLKLMEPGERIVNALEIQWCYLWKQLFPAELQGIYSGPNVFVPIDSPWSWLGILVLVASLAALGGGIYAYRKGHLVGLGALIYAAAFAPTANVLFATGATMAERLAYMPSVGFCLALGALLVGICAQIPKAPKYALLVCTVTVLALFGARTLVRNTDFSDNMTLWKADTRNDPENLIAWVYLANRFWDNGLLEKSEAAFQKALALKPDFTEALEAYAEFLVDRGRFDEALTYALRAEESTQSDFPSLHLNVANIYLELGNAREAAKWLEKARWRYAKEDTFLFLQGWIHESFGDVSGALESYRQIVEPQAEWRLDARMSKFLLDQGDFVGAEAFLVRSIELGETAETWNNLGIALALQGKQDEAREAFARAVELAPEKDGYRENLERMRNNGLEGNP